MCHCQTMASGMQGTERSEEKQLRRRLAVTVRNIQWSYAVYWSFSASQQGVLSWTDGYYNGEIKTRKTTQPMEFKSDQIGLQRSEQLRELYGSLSAGDNVQPPRRPSASLSPEDLTDTEWYYLVCMSFTFNPGQGLPGKSFATNQDIWLNNAQFADSKVFSRSLLAKSASIQTVVCFPFLEGVLELGTCELIPEDPSLIHHVRTSFWELPLPLSSEQSLSSPQIEEADNSIMPDIDHDVLNTMIMENHNLVADVSTPLDCDPLDFSFSLHASTPKGITEMLHDKIEDLQVNSVGELQVLSADDSSNEYCPNQHTDDLLMMDGVNGTSQVQSRQMIDDGFSNAFHNSLNSSDCISHCFSNPSRVVSSPRGERIKKLILDCPQEDNAAKIISFDIGSDDSHYTRTLAAILRNSKQPALTSSFPKNSNKSSFRIWRRHLNTPIPSTSTPQRLLKKVLIEISQTNNSRQSKLHEENGLKGRPWKQDADDTSASHVLSERRRREKLNEKFIVLKSLVPSISKVDKASILADTIEYLKELERRVQELESCREVAELETRGKRKHADVAERTSDNYGNHDLCNGMKLSSNKRKVHSINEGEGGWGSSKDMAADIRVTMHEKEVLIELHCPWRECLLLDVVDAVSNLNLDAHSMQSSTADGVVSVRISAKFRGSGVSSPGMIKQALNRVLLKCAGT